MTLNGVISVILRYSTEFGNMGHLGYLKVVEDTAILCNVIRRTYSFWQYLIYGTRYSNRLLKTNSLERQSVQSNNLINTALYLANGAS